LGAYKNSVKKVLKIFTSAKKNINHSKIHLGLLVWVLSWEIKQIRTTSVDIDLLITYVFKL